MAPHEIATHEQWLAARERLLQQEKQLTRMSDEVAASVRALPWVRVEKDYTLHTAAGPARLLDLFDGRSQLLVYHFMFGPSYTAGCPVNSSIADSIEGVLAHLHARDVTVALVSGAPIEKLLAYRRRMGWTVPWASSYESDFSRDMGVSGTIEETRAWAEPLIAEGGLPPIAAQNAAACGTDIVSYVAEGFGVNTFARDGEDVYRCYSGRSRGVEFVMSYYPILDRTPLGRDEGDTFQTWLRRHDEYR